MLQVNNNYLNFLSKTKQNNNNVNNPVPAFKGIMIQDVFIKSNKIAFGGSTQPSFESLIDSLQDDIAANRLFAAKTLGDCGDTRAIDPLLETLKDKDYRVRKVTADALDKLKWQPAKNETSVYYWMAKENTNKCKELGEIATVALGGFLKSNDEIEKVRIFAAFVLGEIRDPQAVKPLFSCINDDDSGVRQAVIVALGKLKAEVATKPLISMLLGKDMDESSNVRAASAWTLGEIGNIIAVKPLIDSLAGENKDDSSDVRVADALALGKIKHPKAIRPLVNCLTDDDTRVRLASAKALGQIKDPSAVDFLNKGLSDVNENPEVRVAIAGALGEIEKVKQIRPLVDCLTSSHSNLRLAATMALGKIKDPKTVGPLLGRLTDAESKVRIAAIEALRDIGDPKALIPINIVATKDKDAIVRKVAAEAAKILSSKAKQNSIAFHS